MFAAIADTHTTIWYTFADSRISSKAKKTIERASTQGLQVGVSAMTLAEIVYLMEKKRIASDTLARLIRVLREPKQLLYEV